MTEDSSLTVAGAAAALEIFLRTAFPFDPQAGNRRLYLEVRGGKSQCRPFGGRPVRVGAVRILFASVMDLTFASACVGPQSLYEHRRSHRALADAR
jgi:hypothetical protein